MKFIEKELMNKFDEIMEKHNNPRWAVNELEHLVYEKYRNLYEQLDNNDKEVVNHCFRVMRKIYGDKHHTDL